MSSWWATARRWTRWAWAWARWTAARWWYAAGEGLGLLEPMGLAYSTRCRFEPTPARRCALELDHGSPHRFAGELAAAHLAPFERLLLAVPVPVPTTQPRHRASGRPRPSRSGRVPVAGPDPAS